MRFITRRERERERERINKQIDIEDQKKEEK